MKRWLVRTLLVLVMILFLFYPGDLREIAPKTPKARPPVATSTKKPNIAGSEWTKILESHYEKRGFEIRPCFASESLRSAQIQIRTVWDSAGKLLRLTLIPEQHKEIADCVKTKMIMWSLPAPKNLRPIIHLKTVRFF